MRMTTADYDRIQNKSAQAGMTMTDFLTSSTLDKKIIVVEGLDSVTEQQTNYICGTYRKMGKDVCTAHFIRTVVLDEVVLQDLRRVTAFAREHKLHCL